MGYYINPPNETKEEWLNDNGMEVTDPSWDALPNFRPTEFQDDDGVYVCLVDNGPFTAAGICYNEAEFNEFRAPDPIPEELAASKERADAMGMYTVQLDTGDQRPRKWYVVPRKDIIDVCPDVEDRLEAGL